MQPTWEGSDDISIFLLVNQLILYIRNLSKKKFTTLTPISLLIWCKLSFPTVGLKISFLPTSPLFKTVYQCDEFDIKNKWSDVVFRIPRVFCTSSGSGLENLKYGRRDPSRWPRGTLYPQKLAQTSPTSAGRSVGIVRWRTQAMEFGVV
jgi:hypothetical protein